jgi:hypothetical protein
VGRGFAGGLPCQAPSEGDQPFASSPFAYLIPQNRRRASGDLFSASLICNKHESGESGSMNNCHRSMHKNVRKSDALFNWSGAGTYPTSAADFKGTFIVIKRFLLFGTIWSTKKYQMIPLIEQETLASQEQGGF